MTEKKVSIINLDDNRWMNYLSTKEEAIIFHHPNWLLNLCESYGYSPFVIAVINNDNTISAGVPIAEIKSPITGHRWVSLPYSDYCFPLYNDANDLELMIDYFLEMHNSSQAPKMELRWEYPGRQEVKRKCHQVIHTKQLPKSSDELLETLPRSVKRYIRTAIKQGLIVKTGTSIEFLKEFYKLQLLTRARHGIPVQPWRYFRLLLKNLLEQDLGFIFLAFSEDGRCIAGNVVLYWGNTFTIKYGASRSNLKKELNPNYFLMWEGLKWACDNGYGIFDAGRTSIANIGLRDYKNKWKLEEEPLTYSNIGYPESSTKQSGVGKLSEEIIRHSPPIVCKIAGEILYKHFS